MEMGTWYFCILLRPFLRFALSLFAFYPVPDFMI